MKKINFTPLIEESTKHDAFENKTHENVADAIATLMSKNKGNGQTIGIEGEWGSGKSTVIAILKEKLDKETFEYLYFDAWAHEGDPLRRVFLESMIKKLSLKDKDKKALMGRVSNRIKNVRIRTTKEVTTLGRWLSIALISVPVGAAILSTIQFQELTFDFSNKIRWDFWLGIVFSCLPFFVLIFNFFRLLFSKKRIRDKKHWTFLQDDSDINTTQEISEDDERSSIEFEKYFSDIIHLVFDNKPEKHLVIVVDNLDRIDTSDALKIWSTLQTFIKQRNPEDLDNEYYKKIWIIVPYDANGLSLLWHGNPKYSKTFFDKSFQLRVEVPKPVFSDWEGFAQKMINNAFGENIDFKQALIDILRISRSTLNDIPTPREIKTFVNQVGTLALTSEEDISMSCIAYYVVKRYLEIENVYEIQNKIINGDFPEPKNQAFLPENCRQEIAGLTFGVNAHIG